MTYVLYGMSLAFAWFLCVNLSLSVAIGLLVAPICRVARQLAPAGRARMFLTLRLLPATAALTFVVTVFVPSFLRFEPRDFDEAFGMTTTTLAVLTCLVVASAAWRGIRALRDVQRRTAKRRHLATVDVGCSDQDDRAFVVEAPFAAMTLVGILKPRLLVTSRLLQMLTPEELSAAVAHEHAHKRALDNLKRLAMRTSPDVFGRTTIGRRIENEWCLASEQLADSRAALDAPTGVALASALIKVARFGPATMTSREALSLVSPLVGGDSLSSRIDQLLNPPRRRPNRVRTTACVLLSAVLALTCALAYGRTLSAVHVLTEVAVHTLP